MTDQRVHVHVHGALARRVAERGTPRCGARRAALRNEARVLLGAAALPVERARPAAI